MKTRVISVEKIYCIKADHNDLLILVWQEGSRECTEALTNGCPFSEDCRNHQIRRVQWKNVKIVAQKQHIIVLGAIKIGVRIVRFQIQFIRGSTAQLVAADYILIQRWLKMDEKEKEEVIKMANDLQDLMHLISILEGIAERLREEINEMLTHLKEENGDQIGFEGEDNE